LALNTDGTFTYTPDSNFNGSDTFTYLVTDSAAGESSIQTVSITVDPVTDLAGADDSFTTNEDVVLSGNVGTNDSTTSGATLCFASLHDPPPISLALNTDGTFTYTPDSNFNGSDTFTYLVTDSAAGESSIQTVSITVDP